MQECIYVKVIKVAKITVNLTLLCDSSGGTGNLTRNEEIGNEKWKREMGNGDIYFILAVSTKSRPPHGCWVITSTVKVGRRNCKAPALFSLSSKFHTNTC